MPFIQRINGMPSLSAGQDTQQMILELQALYNDLTDMRAKYAALVALLVAGTALGAGYSTGTALNTRTFTPT